MKMINGLRYYLDKEKIVAYLALSVKDKLNWLEDANKFNQIALSSKEKNLQKIFLGKNL